MRSVLCGLSLGACLLEIRPAAAEIPLAEKDGFTFFTDGRINAFFSQGIGDAFPQPTPNTNVTPSGMPAPSHGVVGSGQSFTAGYESKQADANNNYSAQRVRNGFLATILGLGMRKKISETTVTGYVALWGTTQSFQRDRTTDSGNSHTKGFDVRNGYVELEGPWGDVKAGRQLGIFGDISTEIDYNYGHGYGLGLPCVDEYYASCGHIGTGAVGPGFAAGIVYSTPSFGGLKLTAGFFDPVRLLGAWNRVPIMRPEGTITFEKQLSSTAFLKLAVEGMYQPVARVESQVDPNTGVSTLINRTDAVWGVAGGGRIEVGPVRFGASAFRGKGLGAYVALQNSSSSFNQATFNLRSFTGYYAQAALVFGRAQISAGAGRVIDDQLEEDKVNANSSELKWQTGFSLGFFYSLTDYLVLGLDYFRFQTDWWGAPNSTLDANNNVVLLPGVLTPEQQIINFINAGATLHW